MVETSEQIMVPHSETCNADVIFYLECHNWKKSEEG